MSRLATSAHIHTMWHVASIFLVWRVLSLQRVWEELTVFVVLPGWSRLRKER